MIPATMYGRITLALVLLVAVAVIVLESIVAAIVVPSTDFSIQYDPNNPNPQRGVPVYLTIFICGQIFQIVLCWDAVWHQNTIQMIGFVLFNLADFCYAIFQYAQLRNPTMNGTTANISDSNLRTLRGALIGIPVVLGLGFTAFAYLAYKLYLEFGWKIYKKIGADPKMRNLYRAYQIFITLLKLDVFFVFGFGLQFLVLVIRTTDPEFALTIVAIPVMVAILALAVYGVRREDKWIMLLFMFGLLCAIAYFIFKVVRIYTQPEKYADTKYYLTFYASLSLSVVILTLVNSIVCYNNFGLGLKNHIMRSKEGEKNRGPLE